MKKNYSIEDAFNDSITKQSAPSRIQEPVHQEAPVLTTRKSYIDADGKVRRKQFRRDVDRPVQKTVHFDRETSLLINQEKDRRTFAGEPNNTVDDVIYDAVKFWFANKTADGK